MYTRYLVYNCYTNTKRVILVKRGVDPHTVINKESERILKAVGIVDDTK